MHSLALLRINQETKFEVPSFTSATYDFLRYINTLTYLLFYLLTISKDMIRAKFKKGHITLTTAHLGLVCHP